MKLVDLFFPPKCLACRIFLNRGEKDLCAACESQWPRLKRGGCCCCALPFESLDSHLCGDCLAQPKSFGKVTAQGRYRGVLHDLILRLKYKGDDWIARFLGQKLSEALSHASYDLILPIPLSRDRLRERGFNQSLLLGREVSRRLKIPMDPFTLRKIKSTPPQAGLKAKERWENLRGAFEVGSPERIEGKRILLVDDVYTTGATIEMASREILHCEATQVDAVVLARA